MFIKYRNQIINTIYICRIWADYRDNDITFYYDNWDEEDRQSNARFDFETDEEQDSKEKTSMCFKEIQSALLYKKDYLDLDEFLKQNYERIV